MDYWSKDVVSEKFATWNVELVDTIRLKTNVICEYKYFHVHEHVLMSNSRS